MNTLQIAPSPIAVASLAPVTVRHPAARALRHAAQALTAVASALLASSERLEAWLRARAKSDDDSLALGAMSERELRDIGIDPVRLGTMPDRWTRDGAV